MSDFISFVFKVSDPKPDAGLSLDEITFMAGVWLEIYACSNEDPRAYMYLMQWIDCVCPLADQDLFLLPDPVKHLRAIADLETMLERNDLIAPRDALRSALMRRIRRYQTLEKYPTAEWGWIMPGALKGGMLA